MAYESRDFKFLGCLDEIIFCGALLVKATINSYLYVKGGIETHLEMALIVFIENAKEALLED